MGFRFPKRTTIGRVGVATIGVEQHTFRTTVFGFAWVRHHWKTRTNHHWQHTWRTKFPKIKIHWEVGLATIGVEQHTFRTTVFVCVWVGVTPFGFSKNHHWGRPWGTKFPKKLSLGGLGWRWLGLSNTLFVLL